MDTRISDKLVRSGKVLDVVGKVLAAICIIGAAGAMLSVILVAFLPADFVMNLLHMIPRLAPVFNEASLGGAITTAIVGTVKTAFIVSTIGFALYCALCAIILFILSAVFKATAVHRTPFLFENVKRLKIIAIILIVASIALGLTNLIFAFCVFALAYVVQYGVELQQQSDETL